MGILSSIKEKILGKAATATPAKTTTTAAKITSSPTANAATAAAAAKKAQAMAAAAAAAAPAKQIDVEAVVEAAVRAKGEKSNWRVSIVDLLKALDLPSDLNARKELAKELKYDGTDPDGSAEKNIWLHKAVMKALAENGGRIPKELMS